MYKVLLVDDEYMILEGLKRLIEWETLGFQVVGTADNGQEALDFIRQNEVDLVVTDVNMPGKTGIELVEQAQLEGHHFKFVILSGYQEFEFVKAGLKLGAENYLLKPVNKEELMSTVEKVVSDISDAKNQDLSDKFLYEHILQRWVTDDIDYLELKKVLGQLGIVLNGPKFTVLVIELSEQLEDQIITLAIEKGQKLYYLTPDKNYFILIVEGDSSELADVVNELSRLVTKGDSFLGIGEPVVDINDVYLSFNHAFYAVGLKDFYKSDNIPKDKELYINEGKVSYVLNLDFSNFTKALLIRNTETIKNEITAILEQLREEMVSPEYVKHIVFLLFMDIYRQYETLDESFHFQYSKQISEADSFNELEKLLFEALKVTKKTKGSRRYSSNVEMVLKIIHTRYHENLSLKQVSEELYLNVMYLGQLFKKETQKSFSQYLNHYRIKQAQNMLIHSNMNVNEIAYKVGYTSSGYFYKNFKSICGISPSDFREEFINNYNPVDE